MIIEYVEIRDIIKCIGCHCIPDVTSRQLRNVINAVALVSFITFDTFEIFGSLNSYFLHQSHKMTPKAQKGERPYI